MGRPTWCNTSNAPARLEYHPKLAGGPAEVLFGLLGAEQFQTRYPAPPTAATNVALFHGEGDQISASVELPASDYIIAWAITTESPLGCAFDAHLDAEFDERPNRRLGRGLTAAGADGGALRLNRLATNRYFVDVVSTCRWTVTISPLAR